MRVNGSVHDDEWMDMLDLYTVLHGERELQLDRSRSAIMT